MTDEHTHRLAYRDPDKTMVVRFTPEEGESEHFVAASELLELLNGIGYRMSAFLAYLALAADEQLLDEATEDEADAVKRFLEAAREIRDGWEESCRRVRESIGTENGQS